MEAKPATAAGLDVAQELIEELLRTAFALGGAFVSLLDDPPWGVCPGEDPAAVLIEMFAGSARSAVSDAGEPDLRVAMAVVVAVRDRVTDDLRIAACLDARDA